VLAALVALAAVACLAAAVRSPRRRSLPVALARTSTLDPREAALLREAEELPLWERLLRPAVTPLARRMQARWAGVDQDTLRRAGIDTARVSVEEVLAVKVLAGIGAAILVLALAAAVPGAIVLLPAATFGAFVAPSVLITRRRLARRRRILRELPDLVGLLKAFVTAGIPLEQALHLISAQQCRGPVPNLLAAEVRRALSDYGLGLSLDEALDAMARRVGVEEVEMLAAALTQGKRQGAGMERILRDQETVVRLQQRNRAAAEASRVGTRLVGVLVLVYLPEFMVLIMVPLFYGIFLRAFG
jgi:Flp pilus assembly protein TadB